MDKNISKLELGKKVGTPVPTSKKVGTAEVGTRIREVQKQIGTVDSAAMIAGVDSETLNRWMKGATKASFMGVAQLALAAGRSLDWLATGIEPVIESTSCALDLGTLTRALEIVEKVGAGLPPERKARLGAAIYSLYIRSGEAVDPALVEEVVRSAMGDLSQSM